MESGRQLLSDFFSACCNGQAWWYIVLLDDEDDSSLASLFGISMDQLERLLGVCKLFIVYGGENRVNCKGLEQFIGEHMLDVELNKCHLRTYGSKQKYCLRVGRFGDHGHFNAMDQFAGDFWPPKIRLTRKKRDLLDRLEILLQDLSADSNKNLPVHEYSRNEADSERMNLEATGLASLTEDVEKLVSERKTLLHVKRDEILNNFLSKFISPSIYSLDSFWAKDANIETLEIELMSAAMQLRELREQIMKGIRSSVVGAQTIVENLQPTDYPVLTSFGVDLSTDFQVKAILRDISKLSKHVGSTQILSFHASNNKLVTMVQIPRSY
jgi:hypothetical protein